MPRGTPWSFQCCSQRDRLPNLPVMAEILAGRDDFPEAESVAQTFLSAVAQAFLPAGPRQWRGVLILEGGLPTRMSAIRQAGKPALLWLRRGRAAPYGELPNPRCLFTGAHASDWTVGDTAGWATCATRWNLETTVTLACSFPCAMVLNWCVPYSNSSVPNDKERFVSGIPSACGCGSAQVCV